MKSLKAGEVLQSGDEYQDPHTKEWWPTKCVGCCVGIPNKTSVRYRRRVKGGAQ